MSKQAELKAKTQEFCKEEGIVPFDVGVTGRNVTVEVAPNDAHEMEVAVGKFCTSTKALATLSIVDDSTPVVRVYGYI